MPAPTASPSHATASPSPDAPESVDVLVVGAGAAGIGLGVVLRQMGLDFVIMERDTVGSSFRRWPPDTRFISPSFTGNFFGLPDLNCLTPDTSPAFMFETEHPTGADYAQYLEILAEFYELPVAEHTSVGSITPHGDHFTVVTDQGPVTARAVVWAGGEYQFPKTDICPGAEHAVHNTHIKDWDALPTGAEFAIIGAYESGMDTAIHLARRGHRSVIFDSGDQLRDPRSDSSFSLSPYTKDRYRQFASLITIHPHSRVTAITADNGRFTLTTQSGDTHLFTTQPILATGFTSSLTQVAHLFDWADGSPQLTPDDQSTRTPGLYLTGPQVRHDQVIFCFVYKFRQRFAVVAQSIAQQIGQGADPAVQAVVADYQSRNFYLDDLTCCEGECVC